MKPLSEMTREELCELDILGLLCVAKQEGVKSWMSEEQNVRYKSSHQLDTLELVVEQASRISALEAAIAECREVLDEAPVQNNCGCNMSGIRETEEWIDRLRNALESK